MITPVILSGGAGTRLWPASRSGYPKQFLSLDSENSLVQATALRVTGDGFAAPLVVSGEAQRFLIAHSLSEAGVKPSKILLEPAPRNTAPALAIGALHLQRQGDDVVMLAAPADHYIDDDAAFRAAVREAVPCAEHGAIVAFGVPPVRPHTGYGYIRMGERVGAGPDRVVAGFVEKPDAEAAARYVSDGGYLWNCGIFLVRVSRYLQELESHAPEMLTHCRAAIEEASDDGVFLHLGREAFEACPSDSIDYAVMEKTESARVVPLDLAWSDVGSWSALWELETKDAAGNATVGDTFLSDAEGSFVYSDGPFVAAVGLRDMVVAATDDAVLVVPRAQAEDIKVVADWLKASGRTEHFQHRTVHRPWGTFRQLSLGNRFQVKEIMVERGAALSLQKHHHRAEHWIVVEGTAEVTRDDEVMLVQENESVFIPLGTKHRLRNPGKVPLRIVEVQSGSYLGEDDIVRFEDAYGRSPREV